MKRNLLILLISFFVLALRTNGQEPDVNGPVCFEPFAEIFAEFDYTTTSELTSRFKEFEAKISKTDNSRGIIFVFGGQKTSVNEIQNLTAILDGLSTLGKTGYDSKIWIREGGYRLRPGFVFVFKPETCSEYAIPKADFGPEDLRFVEFPPNVTVRLPENIIESQVLKISKAECPPAARAVRACFGGTEVKVFIIVDTKGHVAYSKSIEAHPLMRAAAEAFVRKWEFKEYKQNGKTLNFVGFITLRFQEGPEIMQTTDY